MNSASTAALYGECICQFPVSKVREVTIKGQRSERLDGRDKMKFEAFIVQVSRYIQD